MVKRTTRPATAAAKRGRRVVDPPPPIPGVVVSRRRGGSAVAAYDGPAATTVGGTTVALGPREEDRDFFDPDTRIPTDPVEVMHACHQAYDRFGIIRNIIDMMAELTAKGVDVTHPSASAQRFAREWAARVGLADRTERVAWSLFLYGVCPVRRATAALPGAARRGRPRPVWPSPVRPGHVPIEYTMLDPRRLVLPEDDDSFGGTPPWGGVARYSYLAGLSDTRSPLGYSRRSLFGGDQGPASRPLDPDTDTLVFYKRADYQSVPRPLTYPVLRDLRLLAKHQLADEMALDGAVSQTRVWNLGLGDSAHDRRNWMHPTEAQFDRLNQLLRAAPGGGTQDIIWGFDLKGTAISTDVHHFLGDAKYEPVRKAICHAYGIPLGLLGGEGGAGFTNNAVAMKTLSERLEYARGVLRSFWQRELQAVQLALNLSDPFTPVFDRPSLTDEAAERRLLVELFDRNVISYEAIRERFGLVPEIEEIRVRREDAARKAGRLPPKAGPFSLDWQRDVMNERALLGRDGDPTALPPHAPNPGGALPPAGESADKARVGGRDVATPPTDRRPVGRPPGATDRTPRKRRRVVPVGAAARPADAAAFAAALAAAQKELAAAWEAARADALAAAKKKNVRQLSAAETAALEEAARDRYLDQLGLPADARADVAAAAGAAAVGEQAADRLSFLAAALAAARRGG